MARTDHEAFRAVRLSGTVATAAPAGSIDAVLVLVLVGFVGVVHDYTSVSGHTLRMTRRSCAAVSVRPGHLQHLNL